MTKVELRYRLTRPLDEALMQRIADAHSVYGMLRVRPENGMDRLVVEYDASRLTPAEVDAVLHRLGIPAQREGQEEDEPKRGAA